MLDLGSRDLEPLAALPHTAAYVGSGSASREQQVRLLKHLRAELDRRRTTPGPRRRTVVLLDGMAALRDEYDDFEGIKLLEGLYRAWTDGPEVGMWFAATTARAKSVPSAIDEVTTQSGSCPTTVGFGATSPHRAARRSRSRSSARSPG